MQFTKTNPVNYLIAQVIEKTINKSDWLIPELDVYKLLSPPPKNDMGDLAFPCFQIAKVLKKSPPQIANELKGLIADSPLIKEAKVFGPYLNFYLNTSEVAKIIMGEINDGTYFKNGLVESAPKTIIEFSQPNTHKELHVGHMRNLCLGDALIKLYKYAGVETLSTTFPGDVGTHVAKCLWYFKKYNEEEVPEIRKGAWLGTLYTKASNLLEEQKGTDKEDLNRSELTLILKQLHAGSGEYYDLWRETRQWSIDLLDEVYKWADVSFDSWYWESDVDADSVSLVKEYQQKGLFIEDDGAVGIDLKDDKLGFCLLLKSDGTGLYATKDLELARRKFIDHKVEKSIYVVDNRQSLHFKQVFKTLEKMGFENAKNCYHLQYEMVELTNGAMSSRKGNIVPLQSLIDQMIDQIKKEHLNKYTGQWSETEIEDTANIIASGAIKFGMTKIDANKKIVFDMQEWLRLDGESGPYIQYVYARINSMTKDLEFTDLDNYEGLSSQSERDIINLLTQFNAQVQQCIEQSKTHYLTQYLYQLAKAFNSFYAECPVLKCPDENQRLGRINICLSTASVLKTGLGILGISSPERM